MWTKRAAAAAQIVPEGERRVAYTIDGKAGSDTVWLNTPRMPYLIKGIPAIENAPVMFLDGVRVKPTVLQSIDRTQIESIDVVKGPSAVELYGPDAAAGAIVIRTKKGANRD